MNYPLVSIIIPCFQAARTIEKTLHTVFKQTYRPIEIIAVNDGSTDNTLTVLNAYSTQITIVNQINKGASAARNAGFAASKGQYILFCDSDVVLVNTMIEDMILTLQKFPKAAYCYCNFKFGFHTFDLFPFNADRLRKENYISTMSLIRRDRFLGFNESLRRFQDWDLWKRMLDKGDIGVWINKRLFTAPIQLGGISSYSAKNLIRLFIRKFSNVFK